MKIHLINETILIKVQWSGFNKDMENALKYKNTNKIKLF